MFLYRQAGGSGAFFYVAAARSAGGRWQGSNAVFIGDRIKPETVRIEGGIIDAQYRIRRPGGSMATLPSVVKAMILRLVGGHLEELEP